MLRFFIDSSVLFAAAYSARGYARDLITAAAVGKVVLVVSELVLEETRRNLGKFSPESLVHLEHILDMIPFEFTQPSREDVLAAAKVTVLKDAAILAAAKLANVDGLVSFDRKHILGHPELEAYIQTSIISAQEAFDHIDV